MYKARRLCALGLPIIVAGLVAVAPAAAQFSMRTGALGGASGSRSMSRPLGGFGPGYNSSGSRSYYGSGASRGALYGYPFTYSVWVPDYFDYLNSQSQPSSPYGYGPQYGPSADASAWYGPPPPVAGPQQPVIINQYFGAPGPAPANGLEANVPGTPTGAANANDAQAPGDPIGSPQNYYLIAYKNHAVYTALAYWVEDKTLHYVTTQNTHNQASLELIDLTLTKSLNQRNDVPFTLPGQ
jgi:hypothetical protein